MDDRGSRKATAKPPADGDMAPAAHCSSAKKRKGDQAAPLVTRPDKDTYMDRDEIL
jgi:hypothetical protein